MLKLSETTSPQKLFDYDYVTLYISERKELRLCENLHALTNVQPSHKPTIAYILGAVQVVFLWGGGIT